MDATQAPSEALLVEHVSGPYWGYFLAGYALARKDGFHSYVKIFEDKPTCVWESFARAKVASHSPHSPIAALALAEARAVKMLKYWVAGVAIDVVLPEVWLQTHSSLCNSFSGEPLAVARFDELT